MKIYSAVQMKALDAQTIDEYGIDGIVLMENAAASVKDEIVSLESIKRDCALVVCGRGNNGGDGFALARQLLPVFNTVKIAFFDDASSLKGDCRKNYDIAKKLCIPIIDNIEEMKSFASKCDVIADALYGFGFKQTLGERDREIVDIINTSKAYIVSVDVPSGVCADEGVCGDTVIANKTVTFTGYKIAQLTFPAAQRCGDVCVKDIGIPQVVTSNYGIGETIDDEFVKGALAKRARNAHKGSCGKVLIVGGSKGMSGAVCMSAYSAMRSGAGLVTAALPSGINDVFEKNVTEAMSVSLPEDDNGIIKKDAADKICELAEGCDTIVIGPGMGRSEDVSYILHQCLLKCDKKIIIDADALYALSHDMEILNKTAAQVVVTPHYAEMGRLIGKSAEYVEQNAMRCAGELAKKYNITVVLKGAYTVIAGDEKLYVNNAAGNHGMATGGSGDVLAGVLSSLISKENDIEKACACGVYIHAIAGDLAKEKYGARVMLAGDIASLLSEAFGMVD